MIEIRSELIKQVSENLHKQLRDYSNKPPQVRHVSDDNYQLDLSIDVSSLADDVLKRFDLVEKSADNWYTPAGLSRSKSSANAIINNFSDDFASQRRAMAAENVSYAEAQFIGMVQALIGASQFDKKFFEHHAHDPAAFYELIQHIKKTVWQRYPFNNSVVTQAWIQRWTQLFTMVQNRCSAIHGWAILKAFQLVETNNVIRVYLHVLPSIRHVDPILITWNLHDLVRSDLSDLHNKSTNPHERFPDGYPG